MKKIQQYLNNQLPKVEDDQITKILISNYYDKALQKRWEQQLSEKYGLEAPQKTKAKFSLIPKQLVAVAATFLLFVLAYQLNNTIHTPSSQELVAMHLSEKFPHTSKRKSPSADDARNKAIEAYVTDNYTASIYNYKIVVASEDSTIEDDFFLGQSYLKLNQPKEAINIFIEALKKTDSPYSTFRSKETIHWYLGLAYLKIGDTTSAIEALQMIDGPKKDKAQELLKAL